MPKDPPTNAKERFSDRVDDYVRYRPSYPDDAIDFILQTASLREGSIVADVGAGTGISCGPFLARGCVVHAVEPNDAMRQAAVKSHGGNGRFHAVNGSAEVTGLPAESVDLVTCFQAFHWFNQPAVAKEFRRIGKPGAWVAIVWNERRRLGTPFLAEYNNLLVQYGTDYNRVAAHGMTVEDFSSLFGVSFARTCFGNSQSFDMEGLLGRLMSSSYVPTPGQRGHTEIMDSARALFARHETSGRIHLEYDTEVFAGQLSRLS